MVFSPGGAIFPLIPLSLPQGGDWKEYIPILQSSPQVPLERDLESASPSPRKGEGIRG